MRPPSQMPPRPRRSSNRNRILLVVVLVAAIFFVTSLRGMAGIYTDYLWFDALELLGWIVRGIGHLVRLVTRAVLDRLVPKGWSFRHLPNP